MLRRHAAAVVLALAAVTPAAAEELRASAATGPLVVHRLILEADERFAFDSADLTSAGIDALSPVLQALRSVAEPAVVVSGHADRMGDAAYNRALSLRRAEAVAAYLVNEGGLDRMRVGVAAFGEEFPVVACEGVTGEALKACLAPNRRVEVVFPAAGAVTGDHVVVMREVTEGAVDLIAIQDLPPGSVKVIR